MLASRWHSPPNPFPVLSWVTGMCRVASRSASIEPCTSPSSTPTRICPSGSPIARSSSVVLPAPGALIRLRTVTPWRSKSSRLARAIVLFASSASSTTLTLVRCMRPPVPRLRCSRSRAPRRPTPRRSPSRSPGSGRPGSTATTRARSRGTAAAARSRPARAPRPRRRCHARRSRSRTRATSGTTWRIRPTRTLTTVTWRSAQCLSAVLRTALATDSSCIGTAGPVPAARRPSRARRPPPSPTRR